MCQTHFVFIVFLFVSLGRLQAQDQPLPQATLNIQKLETTITSTAKNISPAR